MNTKHTKRGRPPLRSGAKCKSILVRLDTQEKKAFAGAANLAGVPLAVWMRERLRTVARRELEEAGQDVPFVPSVSSFLERGER